MNHADSNFTKSDEVNFEDKIIQTVIAIALESVDGLLNINGKAFYHAAERLDEDDQITSGIDVEVEKKQTAIQLDIIIEYGKSIPALYEAIQKIVSEEVERMTSLEVTELNVTVADVMTKEQYEKKQIQAQNELKANSSSTAVANTGK